jgi:hypothetical protein
MKRILEKYPVFLLTIPGAFLVHMANYYFQLLEWKLITWEVILYILIPILFYLLFFRNDRIRQKAGVLLLFFLVVFYFFHVVHDWLKKMPVFPVLSSYSVLLPVLAIAVLVLIIYVVKARAPFPRVHYIANLLFLLLFTGGIIEHIYLRLFADSSQHDLMDPQKKMTAQFTPCDTCLAPDIYFMIFDEYTNSKTLAGEFNYDNGWITQYLREKGFHIAENSKSNYYFTQVCLGSILNMNYLERLNTKKLFETKEFFQANYTIYQNELCTILKKQGYEINNYSVFDLKDHPSRVTPFLKELNWRSVIGQTFFHKLNRDIGFHLSKFTWKSSLKKNTAKAATDVRRIEETYNGMMEMAKANKKAPQFTYAHFMLPHQPYYFDSSGQKRDIEVLMKRGNSDEDYVSQVAYTNQFVIAPMVDSIFANAKRPFVIILQGDHGYRNYPPEKLSLEFENFNAIYFPDRDYRLLNDSMSSVNTFRHVVNHFFKQRLPVLKDSLIYLKKKEFDLLMNTTFSQ